MHALRQGTHGQCFNISVGCHTSMSWLIMYKLRVFKQTKKHCDYGVEGPKSFSDSGRPWSFDTVFTAVGYSKSWFPDRIGGLCMREV